MLEWDKWKEEKKKFYGKKIYIYKKMKIMYVLWKEKVATGFFLKNWVKAPPPSPPSNPHIPRTPTRNNPSHIPTPTLLFFYKKQPQSPAQKVS